MPLLQARKKPRKPSLSSMNKPTSKMTLTRVRGMGRLRSLRSPRMLLNRVEKKWKTLESQRAAKSQRTRKEMRKKRNSKMTKLMALRTLRMTSITKIVPTSE